MPPLRSTEFTERMTAAARRLGWNPFPDRRRSTPKAMTTGPAASIMVTATGAAAM